jgi:hypothetical protein
MISVKNLFYVQRQQRNSSEVIRQRVKSFLLWALNNNALPAKLIISSSTITFSTMCSMPSRAEKNSILNE